MKEKVAVCEVGPRDGLQMAHDIMPTQLKSRWIAAIAQAGVGEIEVGSFVPPKLVPQMADTEAIVKAALQQPGLRVMALVPCKLPVSVTFAALWFGYENDGSEFGSNTNIARLLRTCC